MFWKDFLLKLLSLKSPHGGKPPLAPLTDRIKPAVWAATPREAGWIGWVTPEGLQLEVPKTKYGMPWHLSFYRGYVHGCNPCRTDWIDWMNPWTNESINPWINEGTTKLRNQSDDASIHQLTTHSRNQWTIQPTNQPTKQASKQSINPSINQSLQCVWQPVAPIPFSQERRNITAVFLRAAMPMRFVAAGRKPA